MIAVSWQWKLSLKKSSLICVYRVCNVYYQRAKEEIWEQKLREEVNDYIFVYPVFSKMGYQRISSYRVRW